LYFAAKIKLEPGSCAGDGRLGRRRWKPGADPLSERELEVAQLVANGHSSKEIASDLNLSVRTVENIARTS